jgi:cytochrome b6-f complex iron-sulfur subunit
VTTRRVGSFIDALVRNRRPRGFRVSADDAEAMRAAITLRSAHEEVAVPTPQFVDDLENQLRHLIEESPQVAPLRVSRRRWVLEGAAAAAVAGVAVAVDRAVSTPSSTQATQATIAPDRGTWRTVADRSALVDGAVMPFATAGAVGFAAAEKGTINAVSGVCTHQGCLLRLDPAKRQLDCPCHRTAFSLTGEVLFSELPESPPPLPRLALREHGGQVQVFVPTV